MAGEKRRRWQQVVRRNSARTNEPNTRIRKFLHLISCFRSTHLRPRENANYAKTIRSNLHRNLSRFENGRNARDDAPRLIYPRIYPLKSGTIAFHARAPFASDHN